MPTSGDDTTPPTSFNDMTVFADTYSYTQTSDWTSVSTNDLLGYLLCEVYSQAECYKGYSSSKSSDCEGVVIEQQIYCEWSAEDRGLSPLSLTTISAHYRAFCLCLILV
jgi:hypothetical protein